VTPPKLIVFDTKKTKTIFSHSKSCPKCNFKKSNPVFPGMLMVLGAITCPAQGYLLIAVKPKG